MAKPPQNTSADRSGIAAGNDVNIHELNRAESGAATVTFNQRGDRSHEINAAAIKEQLAKKDSEISELKAQLRETEALLSAYENSFYAAKFTFKIEDINLPGDFILSDYILASSMFISISKQAFHRFLKERNLAGGQKDD